MDKKFYYKTPALVAMTLAGTTLVSHQVNAEEQTTNKENKNIIEQHDNASQIQDEQKELKSQSLNVSGTKEYKDPSIIDEPKQEVENTADATVQPTSNEDEQDTEVAPTEDNSEVTNNQEVADDSVQPTSNEENQDTKVASDEDNSEVTNNEEVSDDSAQSNSNQVDQNTNVATTENNTEVTKNEEVSDDSAQTTSNEEEQNSDVAPTEDNTEVTNNEDVSKNTAQTASNEEEQNSEVASTEDNTEVTNNQEVADDSVQPTSNEDEQNSEVASTEDNTEVINNQEVAEDSVQPTSNEDEQDTEVASSEDNTEVTNNEDVSDDSVQPTSNEEEQNSDVAPTEDNSDVTNNEEISEDITQTTSNEEEQNSDVASSEDNSEVTNNEEVSEDTVQPTSNEEEQNTNVTSTEDNTEVTNNEEVSEDTVQPISTNDAQNTEAATSTQNDKVQLETASVQPRVSTFAFRSVSSAPVVKKAVATTSSYSPTVSSSINSQIRNNNYAVPTYVEDFSSHIPKIPYRNGVGKPEGIIAHETANPNSTIQGEIAYMKNNYESAFVHAFVDDNNIIEVAPTDYLAWGAGGVANERFIHVELVRVYGGDRFARSINNYADYIATNLSYYGLPFDSAENDGTGTLWSHDAVSRYLGGTDHSDPYGWFAENNYTFNELVDLVREKYLYKTGSATQPTTPVVSKPKTTTPVVSKPKTTTPVVSKPKTTTPVTSKPKTSTPVVSKPKTTTPVTSKPKTSTPVVSKPKTTTPVTSKPKTSTPVASLAKTVVVNYKGKVNTNASGVYSSVYDTKTKSAANKVGKTFNIGKQSNYNNQVYYLLQDNNGTPLGWVKSSDIQLQNNTKATPKPVASNTAKPKATPKPVVSNTAKPKATPKPVASNTAKPKATSKPVASKTTKANAVAKTVRVNYLGKVNKNISGVYTSVYDQKTVPAINKAGKTFKIGKQSTYNNQTYYLLQDNNAIPLGWVNAKDIQLQKVTTQPKVVNKPTVAQPKKTNAIKSSAVNNQPIVLKENYQNYLIFDNSGYFYSEPSVSKKTLLGSLQNYQYSYFKVITSQKVGNELWYKGLLNGKTVWINAKYLQLATESTNISTSPYTLDQAVDIQMALRNGTEPKKVLASGIRNATRAEVKDAMDTSKYVNDPVQKYQFLDLNKSQNISVTKLNDLLRGKGILENQGNAFSQAAKAVGINEIYLISHALLETGNGTSDLANGGAIDQNGNVDLNAQTKYYNMFGVGAIDKNALYGGIKYAQQAGWNTPEKAILGGAQFIANNYIKSGQNTLYKMRFNPQNPGVHQYATGIDFAKSNAKRISDFYQQIQTDGQYYDVDQYKA
ncbi:glucosaminidase domain-containing protein [Mammaliicoccus sciuri]|uniref:glucosaminidase domain-containing protein n=1 Tax=Mammaliicoccus sciuri TaxID=1296 RepID=UPI002DBD1E28|nr:glucosaminidase domain-containing protein [Mammaliicoccus sciuri]MEB6215234.1 glucosaminidase domain-containing protein [Mammaliicoccus sciuri]MEB6330349.1 glucosaminidase domain-containing protein [Mammaliicoccus sciuri]